jgi:hypothetical protein
MTTKNSKTKTTEKTSTGGSLLLSGYQRKQKKQNAETKSKPKSQKAGQGQKASQQELALKTPSNPSYGWSLRSPQKGKERHLLMTKCGQKCFLVPNTEGFPVCAKYNSENPKCAVDCGGVLSAYRRARQYRKSEVAEASRILALQTGCSWVGADKRR